MLRFCSLVGLAGLVCFVGCKPPIVQKNGVSKAKSHPMERLHTNGGPNGDLVGLPAGLSGHREIVAASEFAMPKTPEELLAQLLRAIQLEDFDAIYKLYYQPENFRSLEKTREYIEDHIFDTNRMGFDKDRWGMKRLVLIPLTEPIQANLIENRVNGVRRVITPSPTHEINFQYDWKLSELHLPSASRISNYRIGEKDGVWYLSTSQPVPSENESLPDDDRRQ